MTSLFRIDVGERNAFDGDLDDVGFKAEDLRFLHADHLARKANGERSVLMDIAELVHRARQASVLWEKVNETTIRVNLSARLRLPFRGAQVEWNEGGSGWVTVERRNDDIYVDSKKIELHLTEWQKKGGVRGHELRRQIDMARVLHPNIMDALVEAWGQGLKLIPESWKQNDQGQRLYIVFWAVGYRRLDSVLFVPCLYWRDGRWYLNSYCLNEYLDDQCPTAVSTS